MKFYSPLRYPGGKAFLASEFERILDAIDLDKPTYVEPYAGGAGAALALLFLGRVRKIVINDRDKAIYAFWKSVVENTSRFVKKINETPVTISEWKKQKKIYENENSNVFDLGFATFFLNRTNRSGVLNAGPIGGMKQDGTNKINARYNKKNLIARIKKIGEYKNRIKVSNEEGMAVAKKYLQTKNIFIYLDPPYIKKGSGLYLNLYNDSHHKELARILNSNPMSNWVLTYEEMRKVWALYPERAKRRLNMKYRVHDSLNVRKARELMILSDALAE